MTPDAVHGILERLQGVKRAGNGWVARCPAHDDRAPSLSVGEGEKGVVLFCHAGCSSDLVMAALGVAASDLFFEQAQPSKRIVATYPYHDEAGTLLFEVVRFDPKDFRQRRPDPTARDGWTWKLGDARRVLYRLPQVLEAVRAGREVWVAEGEKDVHALEREGVVATTLPGGAGKWRREYTEALRGAVVTIVADNDEPGRRHARAVTDALMGAECDVQVVTPAAGKDVSDHLAAGLGLADFVPLNDSVPPASELPGDPAPELPAMRDLVPDEGYIAEFVRFSQQQVMGPVEFHLAAALATLSCGVGRQAFFWLGGRRYPHLWMVLMAPAGGMKSTALRLAGDVVRLARGKDAVLPTRFSPEGFYDALKEAPDGFWNVGEIAGFLRTAGRDYMAGAREDLCDVWDGSDLTRKLRSGTIEVERPAPTAVATGRMSDFEQASGRADFLSGFLSRFIVIRSDDPPIYRGLRDQTHGPDRAGEEGTAELARALRDLRPDASAPVRWDDSAMEVHEEHDRRWMLESGTVPLMLQGWAKRRGIQAAKLAILHAIARRGVALVQLEDVSWGCDVMAACYADVARMTLEEIGLERDDIRRNDIFERARDAAADRGGAIPIRDVVRRTQRRVRGKRELDDLIDLWVASGAVEVGTVVGPSGRRLRCLRFPELGDAPQGWQAS